MKILQEQEHTMTYLYSRRQAASSPFTTTTTTGSICRRSRLTQFDNDVVLDDTDEDRHSEWPLIGVASKILSVIFRSLLTKQIVHRWKNYALIFYLYRARASVSTYTLYTLAPCSPQTVYISYKTVFFFDRRHYKRDSIVVVRMR